MDKKQTVQQIADKILEKKSIYIDIVGSEQVFNSELEAYKMRLFNSLNDAEITVPIGVNIFLEVMQIGLSFAPAKEHIYLSRLKGTGKYLGYKVTIDGQIYQAQEAGAISHLSEPVIVTKEQDFKIVNTPDGKQLAVGDIVFDNQDNFKLANMKVGYVYIVYPNGERELSWITGKRLTELQAKSQNAYLYNDESFIQTKILLHALRKVRKTNSKLKTIQNETDEIIAQNMEHDEPIEQPNILPQEPENTGTDEPF